MITRPSQIPSLVSSLILACSVTSLSAADVVNASERVFDMSPSANKSSELGHIGPTGILVHVETGLKFTITGTRAGSPAAGKFEKGELILAVNGKTLAGVGDPYALLGSAITAAEAADGNMIFEVGSETSTRKVSIQIPALGTYGKNWPVDCPKSSKIIENAAAFYQKQIEKGADLGIPGALPCLFLLSTGDDQYLPLIRKHYKKFIEDPKSIGSNTWNNGYNGIVCAEYYFRTGDKDILPVLQAICDDAKKRMNFNSAWGHWGNEISPSYVAGGLMNSASVSVLTTLLLSKEAGVNVDEKTLLDCLRYFYRFVGHGSVAYGDHHGEGGIGSNGKDGMLAAAMQVASDASGDTSIYQSARDSLSMGTLDGYPMMITGHGDWGRGDGIWRGIASSFLMEKKPEYFREVRDKITWWYDLSRYDDGALGMAACKSFNDPESGAAAAITYTAPRKHLRILGAKRSNYAKEFKLPERIWGNKADLVFHSIEPLEGHEMFAAPTQMTRIVSMIGHAYKQGKIEKNPEQVSTEALQGFIFHHNYAVRSLAAKALRIKGELGTLEVLLKSSDPRLRRAALDGIIGWKFWGNAFKNPLRSDEFTPGMIESITAMLNNPEESWYVVEGALFAVGLMPADAIEKNAKAILPWTKHDDWWLRKASFMAMQGLSSDPVAYLKVVPVLTEMMIRENHTMPRQAMNRALSGSLQKYKPDTKIGRLIAKGFGQGVSDTQVLEGDRGREGKFNVVDIIGSVANVAPETTPQLVSVLVERGLSKFERDEFVALVSGFRDFDGLLKIASKLKDPAKKELEDILYKDFNPEMTRRLKGGGGKDIGMIDALLAVKGLRDEKSGWQIVGSPQREDRVWRYITFHPTAKKDILPKRDGRRFRKIEMASEWKDWFKPGFDDSRWQNGRAPIGKGTHPLETRSKIPNRSEWGEGEFLLARVQFELKDDPDFDLYRLRMLSQQGFQVYLNGKKILEYTWWKGPSEIQKWPMDSEKASLLKKGTNTLAVYTTEFYPSSHKSDWKGDVYGKFDCYIEGLNFEDLF